MQDVQTGNAQGVAVAYHALEHVQIVTLQADQRLRARQGVAQTLQNQLRDAKARQRIGGQQFGRQIRAPGQRVACPAEQPAGGLLQRRYLQQRVAFQFANIRNEQLQLLRQQLIAQRHPVLHFHMDPHARVAAVELAQHTRQQACCRKGAGTHEQLTGFQVVELAQGIAQRRATSEQPLGMF